jgi:hypothetical protein
MPYHRTVDAAIASAVYGYMTQQAETGASWDGALLGGGGGSARGRKIVRCSELLEQPSGSPGKLFDLLR